MEKYLKRAVLGVIYCTVFFLPIVLSSPAHPRSFEWVKLLGTSSVDWGFGVAADKSGNIYVTGDTNGDLDGKTNAGRTDAFIAKYNNSGTRQWVKMLGTASYFDATDGRDVAADKSGNIYVTGTTSGDLNNETNSGEGGAFLAKYDGSGMMQWVKLLGSVADDQVGVTTDKSSNIYVTGSTAGGLGSETPVGGADAFLAKYNSSGTRQWFKLLGTASDDWGFGVAVDTSGNIYITGDTKGNLGGETNAGYYDAFLAKYDSLGKMQWVKLLGNASDVSGDGVAVDTSSNIYITGFTMGDLGGETNAGDMDAFLARYKSSSFPLETLVPLLLRSNDIKKVSDYKKAVDSKSFVSR